jgi:hypothetical protein
MKVKPSFLGLWTWRVYGSWVQGPASCWPLKVSMLRVHELVLHLVSGDKLSVFLLAFHGKVLKILRTKESGSVLAYVRGGKLN